MPFNQQLNETLRLGLIQTNCSDLYWTSLSEEDKIVHAHALWAFVQGCFAGYGTGVEQPDVVLLPELAIPRRRLFEIEAIASRLGIIVITGVDYLFNRIAGTAVNEAYVIVPERWQSRRAGRISKIIRVGKVYPAPEEKIKLLGGGYAFKGDNLYYLFEADGIGRFGVAVCYDLMDLERATLYAGEIQHLFVLAYNQDTQGFMQIAEALSRVMYCNVVICNTGRYGGSLAIAPYYQPWQRVIYRHEGAALATSQLIEIPVRKLHDAQQGKDEEVVAKPQRLFKKRPPIFEERKTKSLSEIQL
jgi:predicted amidohydrolase